MITDRSLQRRLLVGEMLGKTLGEIDEMPAHELDTWVAWVEFQNDQLKKAASRNRTRTSRMQGRRPG